MDNLDLDLLKSLISHQYNWGNSDDWTNFHFNELSLEIEKNTRKKISKETLKRIFGKRKVDSVNYQPQAYSKLALIEFTEYLQAEKRGKAFRYKNIKGIYSRKQVVLTISILVFIVLSLILLTDYRKNHQSYYFTKLTSTDYIPFTATIKYDISELDDSVFVHFGEGSEYYVSPEETIYNYFYKNAGTFKIKLYTRKKILKEFGMIAYGNDWQGGFFPNDKSDQFTSFIDQQFFRKDGFLYADEEELTNLEIDLEKQFYVGYKYFSKFDKSLDHLSLETRVLNNESTGSYACYDIGINLIGESGEVDFKFTCKKCSRYAKVLLSERHIDGRYNDLESLTTNMSDWLPIKLKTENNSLKIYLNDELRLEESYTQLMGELIGINIYFYGSGKIDFVKLADNKSKVFYSKDF